jgi:acyl-coenzyme A thioesterase PaaI-like protein
MILSERFGKFLLNAYLPFVFNRIRIQTISKGYRKCVVRIKKSIFNRNMNGTIFGGALFSASDPFYSILYWQIFERKGYKVQTWLKSASIQYLRPADQDLLLEFEISDEHIHLAEQALQNVGKHTFTHEVKFTSANGDVYVLAKT